MTAVGQRTAVIPMRLGGMWSAGDPSSADSPTAQPENTVRSLRNYIIRPNRWDGRPPFVYDGLMGAANFLRWEDLVNQLTRTIAIDASQNLRIKSDSGIGYKTDVIAGSPSGRLTDFANFMGKVYQMFDNGAGVPSAAAVWDGLTVSTAPFNSTIFARTVTAFIERLFLAYPRVTVTPQFQNGGNAYDIGVTDLLRWKLSGCTGQNVTASGVTICRLYLTSTTAAQFYYQRTGIVAPNLGIINVSASGQPQSVIYRANLRHNHPTQNLPITLEVYVATRWWNNGGAGQARALGDIISDGSGHLLRCTTAGLGGVGAEPAWNTTVGATTNDGAAVWTCEGSDIVGSIEDYVLPTNDKGDFSTLLVEGVCPPRTNLVNLSVRCKFFNSTTTTITLCAVDVSLKDGIADGDARKKNYGQQVTTGDFFFPFFNVESASSATVNLDAIVWSEILQPARIRAQNTFNLSEVAGLPTAAAVIGGGPQGRYLVAKRRGYWIFKRTSDANQPILPESSSTEIGFISPRGWDTWGKEIFWIGENGCYRMNSDGGEPVEFCGEGMREEIMARGSGWVETQSTYNMPFLVVEHFNKEVWVYTQKSKIYVYNIPSNSWSYFDCPNSAEVRTMLFDTIGQRMLVAFGGYGATRLMETSSAKDSIDDTVNTYTITYDVIPKPMELFAPRYEAALLEIGAFHNATASQSGQTIEVAFSHDRGSTWTTAPGYPAQFDVSKPRIPMPMETVGPSVMVRVRVQGAGGPAKWSLSKMDAKLQAKRGELPWANAVTV